MGAKPSQSLGPNDVQYLNRVTHAGDDEIAVFPFLLDQQFRHFYKPCFRTSRSLEILPYLDNEEFRKRIPQSTWRLFNADFAQELYEAAPTCRALTCFSCTATDHDEIWRYNAMYKVISHYNRHLFHPMLIDAQIFATTHSGEDGQVVRFFIGFIIATDRAAFDAIPRPVLHQSSGYQQHFVRPWNEMLCYLVPAPPLEFGLEVPSPPAELPATPPVPPTMHAHSEAYLAKDQEPLYGCDLCICFGACVLKRVPVESPAAYRARLLSAGMSPNALASGDKSAADVQMVSIPVNTVQGAGAAGALSQPYAQVMVREEAAAEEVRV